MKTLSMTHLYKAVEKTKHKETFYFLLEMRGLERKYVQLLWRVYKLVVNTDYLPEDVRKKYSEDSSYAEIAAEYNISESAVRSKLHQKLNSLENLLGIDLWEKLVLWGEELTDAEIGQLHKVFDVLFRSANTLTKDIESYFTVDVFKNAEPENYRKLDETDFVKVRDRFVRFSIPTQQFVYENTHPQDINYCVYLLTTPDNKLSKEDLDRKWELISFARLDDYYGKKPTRAE